MAYGSIVFQPPKIEKMTSKPPKSGRSRAQVVKALLDTLGYNKASIPIRFYGYAADSDEINDFTPFFNADSFKDATAERPVGIVIRRPHKHENTCTVTIGSFDFFVYLVTGSATTAETRVNLSKLAVFLSPLVSFQELKEILEGQVNRNGV